MLTTIKTYNRLREEHKAVLDETKLWKQCMSGNQRMGLWNKSTYLDDLLYIRQRIEKEMIPYEIVFKMGLYRQLQKRIPNELILHIASFGDYIDSSAVYFIEKETPVTIDAVDPTY
jgi:hypothetical protein